MWTYGLSSEQQDEVWRRWRVGEALRCLARDLAVPVQHVRRYLAQAGGVEHDPPARSGRQLSGAEREEISRGLAAGDSFRVIAARLGRPHTTVARQVGRGGGRGGCRACRAEEAAYARARRPKPGKLAMAPRLRAEAEERLEQEWSPEQIARRLPLDHPGEPGMRVSHESIDLTLFLPARRALPAGLARRLRTGRVMRHPKAAKQASGRGRIRDVVWVHDRPAEVADRAVPGTGRGTWWPGGARSAVATPLERYRPLPAAGRPSRRGQGRGGAPTPGRRPRLRPAAPAPVPDPGPGREMAAHAQLTAQTGCPVCFCDPKSPWQRGRNENTHRLLRQYLAKSANPGAHDQGALEAIAARLNNRPRQVPGWATPAETSTALLGQHAIEEVVP